MSIFKKFRLMSAVFLMLPGSCVPTLASQQFGLGVILGDPTGISAKLWISKRQAIAGAIAWSFRGEKALHIHGDYLLHHDLSGSIKQQEPPIRPAFYYGLGGRIKDEKEDKISMRFPLGITGRFTGAPFDIYVELVPLLDLAPATEFDMNAALGARFYF